MVSDLRQRKDSSRLTQEINIPDLPFGNFGNCNSLPAGRT